MRDTAIDRVYRLLPEYIRARDADEGRPLQALMQVMTRELEVVERDMDILYDNWFIETCEDWAVQYIGDLVGTRVLRGFGQGTLRAYVANTLAYRQAKGTLAVIEQLGRDVTGWPSVGVEFFRRLIQTQNVNHVRLDNIATVSLRNADEASLTGGPFEKANHLIDVRDISMDRGRYNIPNVGIFVWRIQSYDMPFLAGNGGAGYLGGIQPRQSPIGPGFRHLDPVGRPIRLFNRPRTEQNIGDLAGEPAVPAPLRRRRVAADLDGLRHAVPGAGVYFRTRPVVAVRLDGNPVPPGMLYCCNLEDRQGPGGTTWRRPDAAGKVHFDPELGRLSLHAADEGKDVEVSYAFGAPHDIGAGPTDRRASAAEWIDPFIAPAGQPLWQIGVTQRTADHSANPEQPVVGTLAEAIAAWAARAVAGARGIIAVLDSATYSDDLTDAAHRIIVPAGAQLAIVAAGWPDRALGGGAFERHAGDLSPVSRRPHVQSKLVVEGTPQPGAAAGALILDGLLVEGEIEIADGDLGAIELRHGTFGAGPAALGKGLAVTANNARLNVLIDHSIIGAIGLGDVAGTVTVKDSIIGEDRIADGNAGASPIVLAAPGADLVVARTTVFGRLTGRTMEGDDSIFVAPIDIARRQQGCIRFSYVRSDSRAPRRFHCAPDLQIAEAKARLKTGFDAAVEQAIRERVQPVFTATVAEHFAFGQLARRCPTEIAEGGEGGTEMGAMNGLFNPMRRSNLEDALNEYLPYGLTAGIIYET